MFPVSRLVNNYSSTVDVTASTGYPLSIVINVSGVSPVAGDICNLLIKGPGTSDTVVLSGGGYITVDTVNGLYSVFVPADDASLLSIVPNRPYTWSFSCPAFRLQGNFKMLKDTGQVPGNPSSVSVEMGDFTIDVSFPVDYVLLVSEVDGGDY